jgi:hypothetical protein
MARVALLIQAADALVGGDLVLVKPRDRLGGHCRRGYRTLVTTMMPGWAARRTF